MDGDEIQARATIAAALIARKMINVDEADVKNPERSEELERLRVLTDVIYKTITAQ